MKTLEQSNAEAGEQAIREYQMALVESLNGIECGKCGHEMSDKPGNVSFTGMPGGFGVPIVCGNCGHADRRLAPY